MSEKLTLFDLFGGTRRMAAHLGESPSTVQSWKTAGRIPAGKQPEVLSKAKELGLDIDAEDIIFPLGRNDMAGGGFASATKSGDLIRCGDRAISSADNFVGNIREASHLVESKGEADSPSPFSEGSPSISSTTGEPSSTPAASLISSSSPSKAA